jgi:hypothetical protein
VRRTGPTTGDLIEAEVLLERKELLRDTIESRGWSEVLLPALRLKMSRIAQTLAIDTNRSLEEARSLQGRYRTLAELCNLSIDDTSLLFSEE